MPRALGSDRTRALRPGLGFGALLALAYAAVVVIVAARHADTGFVSLFGGHILTVEAGSPADRAGLRAGDVIVAVNGATPATARGRESALRGLVPGAPVTLTVRRGPQLVDLSFSTSHRLPFGSVAGIALGAALLALAFVAHRGSASSEPKSFYRSTIIYVVFLAGTFSWDVAASTPLLAIPWFFGMALAAPTTCHFMLEFPAGKPLSRRAKLLIWGPPSLLAGALSIQLVLYHAGLYEWEPGAPLGLRAAVLLILNAAVYLAIGAVARGWRLRRKADEVDPAARRWLQLGHIAMTAPLAAGVVAAIHDVRWFSGGGFRPFIATAMIGGSFTVVLAITRTRFGELDRVLRSGTGHLAATAFAACVYMVVVALPGGITAQATGGSFATALAATFVAAVVFGPLRARVQRYVDERFARDRSRARTLLREAAEFAARTLDVEALQRGVVSRVRDALRAEGAAIYVARDPAEGGFSRVALAGAVAVAETLEPRDPAASRIALAIADAAVREVEGGILAAPIAGGERAGAALLVVPSPARRLDEEDCELLATLAAQLGIAFANARAHTELRQLSERLRAEVEIAERRRREIARLKERVEEEKQVLEAELARRGGRAPVIGPGLRPTFELAQRVAKSDVAVLVHGETGVGKELVARAIHAGSARRGGPFVVVDCGAIPAGLFESALFGHERGAFTGATRSSLGAFRAAHGGTIFLDEIGELPLDLQPKLLRVLQEKEVRPVGGEETIPVDVRIVAGTNRDLVAEVAAGRFREDLLYRLRVIEIEVPPLRARKRDIPELAENFLRAVAERRGLAPKRLSADALQALLDHDWPGNVRELEHAIEAAAVTSDGEEIKASDLPIQGELFRRRAERAVARVGVAEGSGKIVGLRETLETLEREKLLQALRDHGGNRSATAKALGMSRGALLRRLQRYGVAAQE